MIASGALTLDDPRYFDRLAEAESNHWWSQGLWKLATHWLDHAMTGRRGLLALDVGCGAGGTLARLARRPEITSAVGLDPSPSALRYARLHGPRVLAGDATALPFEDRSFDLVTCLDVWQHLPTGGDLRSAREIRRVLRPGGLALIRANGRGLWPEAGEGHEPYTLDAIVQTLRSAGLRPRRASYANCIPAVGQEILGRCRPRSPGHSSHPAGGGLTLRVRSPARNRVMGRIAAAEAFLAGRLGLPLPVGHSTLALAVAHES